MLTITLRKSRNSLKVGIYLLPFSKKQTKKVCGRIDSSNNVFKKKNFKPTQKEPILKCILYLQILFRLNDRSVVSG